MYTSLLLSTTGILFTMVGAFIAFINSPINKTITADYTGDPKIIIDKKNKYLKCGFGLIMIGSFLQLLANLISFVPSCI